MGTLINIHLMTYLILVAIIGTLGNGVILLAYGNRWNSSKSTSVIFILVLACVDLGTCLIVVPTIAIMEYRDFAVPTPICRFYSFSKSLIIISSFIMSFIAFDRFLNIALPHCRLLNPRRVKALLTLFIAIGVGLGTLTALAFSTQLSKRIYRTTYYTTSSNGTDSPTGYSDIEFAPEQNATWTFETVKFIIEALLLPNDTNLTVLSLEHQTSKSRCFADTSIISEGIREILKSSSNKAFYTLVGIVTVFYSITFVLALRRQNPRIRALKKSLNVLNRFDAYPSPRSGQRQTDSVVSVRPSSGSSGMIVTAASTKATRPTISEPLYEMSDLVPQDDDDEHNLASPPRENAQRNPGSISDATPDELPTSSEKFYGTKQVSFQIEHRRHTLNKEQTQRLSLSTTASLDGVLHDNHEMYYKLPCPCSTTRQLFIKFHFARPPLPSTERFCCCCRTTSLPTKRVTNPARSTEDESVVVHPPPPPTISATSASNSETLRKQLHRHRIQQLRMASTFLIITISFVLFYLPSILVAERIIKSPLLVYYLFLCTHALNPIIYCFMNPSLRAYVLSMFRCRRRTAKRSGARGRTSFFER